MLLSKFCCFGVGVFFTYWGYDFESFYHGIVMKSRFNAFFEGIEHMAIGIRESHARVILQSIIKGPISISIHMVISIADNGVGCQY